MRFRFLSRTLSLLCGGVLLSACSIPILHQERPVPVARAEADYARGRSLHMERRYGEAIAAYEAALKADARHVNAQNGLAVAYAAQHDFDRAISLWGALTREAATAFDPGSAFLFANLGYAYFLKGDYEKAVVALETASLLDPRDSYALEYLGQTLQSLGKGERARQVLSQADALRPGALGGGHGAASDNAPLPVSDKTAQNNQGSGEEQPFVEITSTASGLLELRRMTPGVTAARKAPAMAVLPIQATRAQAALPDATVLEIRYGRGARVLAQQVSRGVVRSRHGLGVRMVRLASGKGKSVAQTRIEYQLAYRHVAERLARHIGIGKPVMFGPGAGVKVRLVVGRDLAARRALQRPARLAGRVPDASAPHETTALISQR